MWMIAACDAKARQAPAAGIDHQRRLGGVAFPEPRLTGRIFHTAQTIGKPSKMGVRKEKILTSLIEKKLHNSQLYKKSKQKAEKAEYW
jgi:hypothetical protein